MHLHGGGPGLARHLLPHRRHRLWLQRDRGPRGPRAGRGKAKEEAAAGGAGAAGGADGAEAPKKTFKQALGAIFSNRLVVLVFAASSLRYMGGYAIAGYLPTFYGVVFPSYDDQYSYINAYVVASGGFLSSWLGGMAAEKWRAVEPKARMYLPACGCFGAIPFMAITCLAPNFYVSIFLGLFMEYLVAECWFGPVVATMQSALEPDCRALAIACFTSSHLLRLLASYAIGVIYDALLSSAPRTALSSGSSSGPSSQLWRLRLSSPAHARPGRAPGRLEKKPLLGDKDGADSEA